MPDGHLATATTMLGAAIDVDEPSDAATLLSLIESRFRKAIGEHGTVAALVVELAASSLLDTADPCDLLTELETSDATRQRELLDGLPVPNRDLPRAHPCFYSVWKTAPREAQHRDRLHRGEPRPELNTRGLHELGIFFGEHVAGVVESASLSELPAAHRAIFAQALDFARRARDDAKNAGKPTMFLRPPDADLLNLSYYVQAFADAHLRRGRASVSESTANHAAEIATRLLSRDPARAARFVRELGEELRRLDVVSALGARTVPSSRITEAVYRAENVWLARLESDAYGLLLKRGRTLTWLEGEVDEVLASVPDEFFEAAVAAAKAFATAAIDRFFREVWTFGAPRPDVYYDPRTASPGPPWASLHAKCVIVDDAKSLITSANFTDRGQSRNIEAGVLIEDVAFAEQLAGHWRQLVGEGLVKRFIG